jgi:hypothetical protein
MTDFLAVPIGIFSAYSMFGKNRSVGGSVMSKIYTTVSHPKGYHGLPWFEIRGNKIYTTVSHPEGYQGLPWYEIRG